MKNKIPKSVVNKYGKTHTIEIVKGTRINLKKLSDSQFVLYGGKDFHLKLTKIN